MKNVTVAQHLWRSLKGNKVVTVSAVAVSLLSIPALFIAAVTQSPIVFGAALALAYLCEQYTRDRAATVLDFVGSGHVNMALRFAMRDASAVLLLATAASLSTGLLIGAVCAVTLTHMLRFGVSMLNAYITNRRKAIFLTRNIDLSALQIPDAPHRYLTAGGRRRLLHLPLFANVGAVVDAVIGTQFAALSGGAIGVVLGLVLFVPLAVHARRVRHLGDRARFKQVVLDELADYSPEVVLYFSHEPKVKDSAYQVNMWLSTLEKLRQRFIVLVREPQHVERISPTNAPIVCIPGGSDVVNFDLPSLKLALYPGNTGKNIHLLRNNALKHVFVGHGDSDKASSANPFCTVYDQVWTAGRAGRDRFHRAKAGVADERMIEVGRPQLDAINEQPRHRSKMFTILYAPTWEGWSNDMHVTSLQNMGLTLIEMLAKLDAPVRVIYKPHPLTGIRDKHTAAVNKGIRETLRDANLRRNDSPQYAGLFDEAHFSAARHHLGDLHRQIADLRKPSSGTDALQRARDNDHSDERLRTQLASLQADLVEAYWRKSPDWHHRTVKGATPHLYDCFAQADMLISDVSSVVSDFIATGKPYVICNPGDVDATTFRANNTAAGGAYILQSDCAELPRIVSDVRNGGPDPMAAERAVTRKYLLGPDSPPAQQRFAAAVDALTGSDSAAVPPQTSAHEPVTPQHRSVLRHENFIPAQQCLRRGRGDPGHGLGRQRHGYEWT